MSRKPTPTLREGSDASQLLQEGDNKHELPIAVLEVPPLGQTHISLGEYTLDRPPIGFAIEITPDYESDDVVVQVTSLAAAFDEFELTLHIANYRDKVINAEVFRLQSGKSQAVPRSKK